MRSADLLHPRYLPSLSLKTMASGIASSNERSKAYSRSRRSVVSLSLSVRRATSLSSLLFCSAKCLVYCWFSSKIRLTSRNQGSQPCEICSGGLRGSWEQPSRWLKSRDAGLTKERRVCQWTMVTNIDKANTTRMKVSSSFSHESLNSSFRSCR